MKNKIKIFILLLPFAMFSQQGIFDLAVEISTQQKAASGPSLLAAPLSSNPNPELITGNAAAFGSDEVNGTTGVSPIGASTIVTSILEDDGYVGDYVLHCDVNGDTGGYARAEHTISVSSSTTYDLAFLYRHVRTSGSSGRLRVSASSGTLLEVNGFSTTTWGLLNTTTQTFTTGASDTSITISIWPQRPFTSPDGGEELFYKLSVKQQ